MPVQNETKSLTVRLQQDLYESASRIAWKRSQSLNAQIQQGLEEIIRLEEDRELYDVATLLGSDSEAVDVEYAFPAQAEVVLRDES